MGGFMKAELNRLEPLLPPLRPRYWMGGLRASAAAFFYNWFSVLVMVFVAESWGLLLGATVMNVKTAQTLATILMLTFMLVGGFYTTGVPGWITWVKWLSFIYYVSSLPCRAGPACIGRQTTLLVQGFALVTKIEFSDVPQSEYSQFIVDPKGFTYEVGRGSGRSIGLRCNWCQGVWLPGCRSLCCWACWSA